MKQLMILLVLLAGCIGEPEPAEIVHIGLPDDLLAAVSDCDMMDDPDRREFCYVEAAEIEGQKKICDLLDAGPYKDRCLWGVARVSGDESLCAEIENPRTVRLCSLIVANDRDGCGKLDDESEKIACLHWTDKG